MSRKRQARLAFTPIPSSSPAAKHYNSQIQERAAAVRYDDDSMKPSKRRKLQANHATLNDSAVTIPTPSTSLPRVTADGAEDSDDEPVRSSQRRSVGGSIGMRKRPRQQRIAFENAVPTPSRQSVNMQSPVTAGPSGSNGNVRDGPGSASSNESDVLPSPSSTARKSKSRSKASKHKRKLNDDGFMGSSGSRVTRSSKKQALEDDSDDEVAVREDPKPQVASISDDDEDEDEEDQMPTTLGTQRRRATRRSSFLSSSPPAALDSDDDLQIIDNPKKARSGKHDIEVSGDEDEEEDEDEDVAPVTPGRRKLVNQRKLTQQEQEDLDEDLGFLEPSSDVDEARRPRNTQSSQTSARMKALDLLKQKRSSQRGLPEIIEDEEDDEGHEDGGEDDGADDDEGSVASEEEQTYAPASSRSMFQADAEDEDFLVEEGEDDLLGVPEALPIEFSRYASMKTKELFGYAVDWMVQKKINPAFPGDDGLYKLTFKKLNDEVSGLVGSKFHSSAWTPDFTVAIRSRPVIAYTRLDKTSMDNMFRDKCDACNRTGHPATYEVQFQKKPYDRDTLDEVNQNEDDDESDGGSSSSGDDSDDGDRPDWNADGVKVPPANRIWYLGKFCMSNAHTAHALQHWRLHLYEWVVEWIDKNGYSTPEKLKKRDRMSTNKRKKYAHKIKDRMEAEGVIKTLWKEFRSTIDEAVNAKQGRYGGDSP